MALIKWTEWGGATTYSPEQLAQLYPNQLAAASLLYGGSPDWQDFGNWQRAVEEAGGNWIVVKGLWSDGQYDRVGLFSTVPIVKQGTVYTGDYTNAEVEQPVVETSPESVFAPLQPVEEPVGDPVVQASVGGWAMKWFALAVIGYWMLKGKFRKKKKRRK